MYSKSPYFDTNAVFGISSLFTGIWLYAEVMSRGENNTESDIASRQSSVQGRGNASGLVSIFSLR